MNASEDGTESSCQNIGHGLLPEVGRSTIILNEVGPSAVILYKVINVTHQQRLS